MSPSRDIRQARLLRTETPFEFTINKPGEASDASPGGFIRIPGGGNKGDENILRLNLKIPKDKELYSPPCLHTDLPDGEWKALSFTDSRKSSDQNGEYSLKIPLPAAGYFSFRFFIDEEDEEDGILSRYWEPAGYHKLLMDPPLLRNLRMYTLLPTVSGKIKDWIKTLGRIGDMGFNAVHILPFTAMGPSQSPYSAADYFAIDEHYLEEPGDFSDFSAFTEEAASRGISICFDIVLNHVSNQSRLASEHADWLLADPAREDGFKRAGCWHQGSWISWEDLVLINYDHPDPAVRQEIYDYMLGYVLFWIEKASVCGAMIRLDNLHSSNETFLLWLLAELRKRSPRVPVLSEFFGSRDVLAEGVKTFGLNMITANTWESPFVPMLSDFLKNLHSDQTPGRYYLSPTSHDTDTAAQLFGTAASSIPRYFCCALMGTGQAGIVQGFEWGWDEKINFIGRHEKCDFTGKEDFSEIISSINGLLSSRSVFEQKGISMPETGDDSLLIALREDNFTGQTFLLGANFNTENHREFPLEPGIKYKSELLYRTEPVTNNDGDILSLKIGSCGVFVMIY